MWKVIEEFPNYSVSTKGVIRSDRFNRILKTSKDIEGYLQVSLQKYKKEYCKKIHKLVGQTYIPNPHNKRCVDHIDKDRTNNCVENLRWSTDSENQQNRKVNKNNKLRIKNISYNTRDKYIFKKQVNGKITLKHFQTLEKAIAFKNKWYDENGTQFSQRQ